jgi:hypothetical protein
MVEYGDSGGQETSSQPAKNVQATTQEAFTRDDTFEVLSNQRRRFTVHYLKHHGGEVGVSELADHVAAWENTKTVEELDHRERKRVRNALRQFHLPKMAEHGFIEYDARRGVAGLTDIARETEFYVDSLTGGEVPWGVYYLGLSGLSAVSFAGLWAGIIPPLAWGVFVVVALCLSSLGHFYDNYYRMRLGANERPAEVDGER